MATMFGLPEIMEVPGSVCDLSTLTGSRHEILDDDSCIHLEYDSALTELYGRTRERLLLLKSYQRVLQTKRTETVVVHGESGVGKSSLVNSLRSTVVETQGYFCSGKFSQNSALQEPYSAIMACFSDLCDLVIQSDDFDYQRRSAIQETLGMDGYLLRKAISNLSPLLPEARTEGIDVGLDESFIKFTMACKSFLRAVCSSDHPIVLFIDDVQWMDEGSRQLIASLLRNPDPINVMIVFAYRDEDASLVDDTFCQESGVAIVDVPLSNLDLTAVHQMVSSFLGMTSPRIQDLSNLISTRTDGNPFFVRQFVEVIKSESLLNFNDDSDNWSYDSERIQREVTTESEDLATDLLSYKTKRLSQETQEVLKIAALLGFCFLKQVLLDVVFAARTQSRQDNSKEGSLSLSGVSPAMVVVCLQKAVEGGFLAKTKEGYKFTHDKLQSMFQSMIDDDQQEELHLLIGEMFLSKNGDQSTAYNAVVHLDNAKGLLQDDAQRVKWAHAYLEASKDCREQSAFIVAARLLRTGIEVLDPMDTKWSDEHFELTFELTESFARMEMVVGNPTACIEATREALLHAKSVEASLNSMLIDVEVRIANHDFSSIAIAKKALGMLGIDIPAIPAKIKLRHVLFKFLNVKKAMSKMTDDSILSLPMIQDRTMATAVKLLSRVYLASQRATDQTLRAYAAILAMELTLQWGLSPLSANALAMFAMIELRLGHRNRAYRLGKLALKMLNRVESDEQCAVVGVVSVVIAHWKEPLCDLRDQLLTAVNTGIESLDIVMGSYALLHHIRMSIALGVNLDTLEKIMRVQCDRLADLGQDGMLKLVQPPMQFAANLRSESTRWESLAVLSGDFMQEDDYMRDAAEADIQLKCALSLKGVLACTFGFYSQVVSIYEELNEVAHGLRSGYGIIDWTWRASFAHFELYRSFGKRRDLTKARRLKKALEKIDAQGCPNTGAFVALLVAQELSVCKPHNATALTHAYRHAIKVSRRKKLVHIEALANEQAGFASSRLKFYKESEAYIEKAKGLYRDEWGSIAKCEWLRSQSECMWGKAGKSVEAQPKPTLFIQF